MGCADGLDALAARARVLWVPVHLGGGVVRKPCERLCAFLETDRMGFGDTLPHATTLPSDLMGSGDKRHGLWSPWEGAVLSARRRVGDERRAGEVYFTLGGKGLTPLPPYPHPMGVGLCARP